MESAVGEEVRKDEEIEEKTLSQKKRFTMKLKLNTKM